MRDLLVIGLFLTGLALQGQLAYEGRVLDAGTGEPIPFVNIGIPNRGIGTVSDADGNFLLEFRPDRVAGADLLRISSLGYEPRVLSLSSLKNEEKLILSLQPQPIALQEVVLSNLPTYQVEEEVGYPDMAGRGIGYWKDSVALGGELASLIRVGEGLRKLNTLFFEVLFNPSDSLQLRVNFYKGLPASKYPGENLNQSGKNILYTLKAGQDLAVIDLEPYDIWVRDDFIASLELLGVYGTGTVGLSLPAGTVSRAGSYRRYTSQGTWERLEGSAVGYYFQSTLYTDNPRRLPKARVVRKRQKAEREITGFVFYAGRPLEGVKLRNYTQNETYSTNASGRYRLKVAKGDILGISYPGLKPLVIEIENPRNFNFQLEPE